MRLIIFPISSTPLEKIGAKARNLVKLMSVSGCYVPEFFVISTEAHKEILKSLDHKTPAPFARKNFKLPPHLNKQLRKLLKGRFSQKLVVRSSALPEDTPFLSFAGQYASFLGIVGWEKTINAIRMCYNSLVSENARVYAELTGNQIANQLMAVIVQQMANVDVSGVMFTADPVFGEKKKIIIEDTSGLGDQLTSGNTTPAIKEIDKSRPQSGMLLEKLRQVALSIESLFDSPQDVEWGYSEAQDKLFLFQSRPITFAKVGERPRFSGKNCRLLLSGRTASPGLAEGKLRVINKLEDLEQVRKGDLLLARRKMSKKFIAPLRVVGGLIFSGGILSHFGVIMRELNIPCLGCVKLTSGLESLKDRKVVLDARGKLGSVYLKN